MEELPRSRGALISSSEYTSRRARHANIPDCDYTSHQRGNRQSNGYRESGNTKRDRGSDCSLPSISSLLFYTNDSGVSTPASAARSNGDVERLSPIAQRPTRASSPDVDSYHEYSSNYSDKISLVQPQAHLSLRNGALCDGVREQHYTPRLRDISVPDSNHNVESKQRASIEMGPGAEYHKYGYGDDESTICPLNTDFPTASKPWAHHHHSSPSTSLSTNQPNDRYVCMQCTKTFSRPSSLRIHNHSHTGEKPFICPHDGCGKAFSVRSNMKRHERGCHPSQLS